MGVVFRARDSERSGEVALKVLRTVDAAGIYRFKQEFRAVDANDPHQQRRDAFRALRDLLTAVARKRSVVVSIDDLQWGDLDSAALLTEVLRPPGAPPIMLIAAYRTEDAEASAFLATLRPQLSDATELSLGPLSVERARELAEALRPSTGGTRRPTRSSDRRTSTSAA